MPAAAVLVRRHRRLPLTPNTYTLAYSPTSGSIFEALAEELLETGLWEETETAPFNHVNLILGDRYAMDGLIKEWKAKFGRPGRGVLAPAAPHTLLVNYYSGTKELTLKSKMVRHLRLSEKRPYDLTPVTYILKATGKDERVRFTAEFDAMRARGQCPDNLWIVKPARMNKALGIQVMRDFRQILSYVDTNEERGEWVVQKYIEDPFLIAGRKFDIRAWVVVGPNYDVYLWQEGVFRTASEKYAPDQLDNPLVHLTNHCVQQAGPNFSKYEVGNEMWYPQFQAYLDTHHPHLNFQRDAIPKMKAIVKACLRSVKNEVVHSVTNAPQKLLCYQVFGFDFMLDAAFNVWLIEINGQPAVAEALLPQFTKDFVELIVRPNFPMAGPPARHRFDRVD
eukprot:NODE_2073_length_1288_cov_6.565891_g1972_i0.p1 GENE.NODE_2073_length_1288_cov_6.565891_g1972_i0~~NODE_2073_length_1288_cov_6.565891_g1972_i0.p1  ORF type:complete len:405 (+),score=124.89 NODE_2073_length_1288_cov_6.565891_g1972_i0:37-1215(+)